MALSKVALYCFESSPFLKLDILNARDGLNELNKKRNTHGEFSTLYNKYRKYPNLFYEYTRLSVNTFDYIVENIEEHIESHSIKSNRTVSAAEKLFLTLRYLAHGTSFNSLAFAFRRGRSTVPKIIYQTLIAIWKAFSHRHLPPLKQKDLKKISLDFFSKWQFPNCIGSIDERHLRITKAQSHESRKRDFVLVLQAISDADYNFIRIEIADRERQKKGGAFHSSLINKSLNSNTLNIPPPQKLPGLNVALPHVLVGDEAYPLRINLMRPYPTQRNLNNEKEIFNERLSRARTTSKGAFGVFATKWSVFTKPLEINANHAKLMLKVACVLHNIVRQRDGNSDKDFREFMENFQDSNSNSNSKIRKSRRNNRASLSASAIREKFKQYFVNNPI